MSDNRYIIHSVHYRTVSVGETVRDTELHTIPVAAVHNVGVFAGGCRRYIHK